MIKNYKLLLTAGISSLVASLAATYSIFVDSANADRIFFILGPLGLICYLIHFSQKNGLGVLSFENMIVNHPMVLIAHADDPKDSNYGYYIFWKKKNNKSYAVYLNKDLFTYAVVVGQLYYSSGLKIFFLQPSLEEMHKYYNTTDHIVGEDIKFTY